MMIREDILLTEEKNNNSAPLKNERFERLAELSRLCVGSSTTGEFAKRANLSRSFISAITNNSLKAMPSKKSLMKMTSDQAKPENGITYELLLDAAGYKAEPLSDIEVIKPLNNKSSGDFLDHIRGYAAGDVKLNTTATLCFVNYMLRTGLDCDFNVTSKNGDVQIEVNDATGIGKPVYVCVAAFAEDNPTAAYAIAAAILQISKIKLNMKIDDAGKEAMFYLLTDNKGIAEYMAQVFEPDDVKVIITDDHMTAKDVNLHPVAASMSTESGDRIASSISSQ